LKKKKSPENYFGAQGTFNPITCRANPSPNSLMYMRRLDVEYIDYLSQQTPVTAVHGRLSAIAVPPPSPPDGVRPRSARSLLKLGACVLTIYSPIHGT